VAPAAYRVSFRKEGCRDFFCAEVEVGVGSVPSLHVTLEVAGGRQVVTVRQIGGLPLIETTGSVVKTNITEQEINDLPLASRSFANMAYAAPMTEPVEPSDPP